MNEMLLQHAPRIYCLSPARIPFVWRVAFARFLQQIFRRCLLPERQYRLPGTYRAAIQFALRPMSSRAPATPVGWRVSVSTSLSFCLTER
jgi:hypothetical protein